MRNGGHRRGGRQKYAFGIGNLLKNETDTRVGVVLRGLDGRWGHLEGPWALPWNTAGVVLEVLGSFLNCLEYDPLENLMYGLNLRKSCTSTWL